MKYLALLFATMLAMTTGGHAFSETPNPFPLPAEAPVTETTPPPRVKVVPPQKPVARPRVQYTAPAKHCNRGCPCGNSCISCNKRCRK